MLGNKCCDFIGSAGIVDVVMGSMTQSQTQVAANEYAHDVGVLLLPQELPRGMENWYQRVDLAEESVQSFNDVTIQVVVGVHLGLISLLGICELKLGVAGACLRVVGMMRSFQGAV